MAWFDPATSYASGGMDRETGQNLPAALWQRLMDSLLSIGGTTGRIGCRAAQTSGAQSINNNAWTSVALDSEQFDTDPTGTAIHDNATNNSRLTCRTAGSYTMAGSGALAATAGGQRLSRLLLNGTTVIAVGSALAGSAGGSAQLIAGTTYDLAAGDYVEFQVFQDSGAAINLVSNAGNPTVFAMMKV